MRQKSKANGYSLAFLLLLFSAVSLLLWVRELNACSTTTEPTGGGVSRLQGKTLANDTEAASSGIVEPREAEQEARKQNALAKQTEALVPIQQQQPRVALEPTQDQCRKVFRAHGQGGNGVLPLQNIERACRNELLFDVCGDLLDFTGLSKDELYDRLQRKHNFHFEGEHAFWNPQSVTELAWYYSTSVNYLFANAIHAVWKGRIDPIATAQYEPVLDYSGGVGNTVLYLASKGIACQYFGVGMMEFEFANYRVQKRPDISDKVTFLKPYAQHTDWKFDPIHAPLKRDQSLGAIIATDVLEHIPHYERTVEAMVDSLRVGGVIIEKSPFAQPLPSNNNNKGEETIADVRIHVSNGGIDMATAMGPRMKFVKEKGYWEKISN